MCVYRQFIILLVLLFSVNGQTTGLYETGKIINAPVSHELWTKILRSNISPDGLVDYQGIKNDKHFKIYIQLLESNHPNENWSIKEQLVYWINTYNAFTVKLIHDHWPLKSIKDIPSPWDRKFIEIENKTYSLNDIEHQILRKKFDEPRIHFAINCASFSCPVMVPFAFDAEAIDQQLDKVTRDFINDNKRNLISSEVLKLSRIFKWFKDDFTKSGSLQSFVQKYTDTEISNATKIEYLEYNWSLNRQND